MKSKWLVRKLDGVWQVFDPDGNLRYASNDWHVAYSFARLGIPPRPKPKKISTLGWLFD